MTEIMIEKEEKVKKKDMQKHILVLFNDDEHTTEYVIACLIGVCEHTPIQAEQCTMIVHHKGKCSIKSGTISYLIHINSKLTEAGLTTEIQ
tara:strand:- start:2737 stop:3009 length:273 start_codon:yes stop_codon:yes gene_type:complete